MKKTILDTAKTIVFFAAIIAVQVLIEWAKVVNP